MYNNYNKTKPLNHRLVVIISLIVILAALFFTYNLLSNTKSTKDVSTDKQFIDVRLATIKSVCGLPLLIAHNKGFFKDEGLNVKINYLEAGRYDLDALVSDSVDLGMIVDTNVSYFGYTGNTSVVVIATIQEALGSAIIAKKSSGINKPEDLKGKRLALSPGTTSDTFANRFIKKYNLADSGLKIEKIQPLAISSAVISGNIDAASTWDPHIYNISKILGDDVIIFHDPEIYTSYALLATRRDWASKNKEAVPAFLRAMKRASKFVNENKEEAQEIAARLINMDVDIVRNVWDFNKFEVSFDNGMIEEINKQGIELQATDEYKNKPMPDYSVYFDSSYIDELNK